MKTSFETASLFPVTAEVNQAGHLVVGGCDTARLAAEFGTPLYVLDEETLRRMCREFVGEFASRYPNSRVAYASKAFVNPTIARLVGQEGLGLDVVSGGELAVAASVKFPAESIYFHGNNKTPQELKAAMDYGVGRIVVDGFRELGMVDELAGARGRTQAILLRLSPGVDPHTHAYTTTGILDSKFGFPIANGQAAEAVSAAMRLPNVDLVGLHFHLGSPIFDLEPYAIAIDAVLTLAAPFCARGLDLREFSPGGGFAIGYVREAPPPPVAAYADAIATALAGGCRRLGLAEPTLVVEPGRAIVGRAGVAVYTVGLIKDIPSVRKYVALDGGMGDNIRPALYGARYEAVVANRMDDPPGETVTLVGKFCESGDVLVRDVALPTPEPGDLVAMPASGAYALPMASNYNLNPRPPVVIVAGGNARLIRRRETYQDLMRCDVP